MKSSFDNNVKQLKTFYLKFDKESFLLKRNKIIEISKTALSLKQSLIDYYEILVFLLAYPSEKREIILVEKELSRISKFTKKNKTKCAKLYPNSALPFTPYISRFSHDCTKWLLSLPQTTTSINGYENSTIELGDALKHTLPSIEVSDASAGWSNDELFEVLSIPESKQLNFICDELSKLNDTPFIKDHFFDGLGIYSETNSSSTTLSKAYNKLNFTETYYHSEIIKRFDAPELLNRALPQPTNLSTNDKINLIDVTRKSLTILGRETDPITFMDEQSIRLYELEHGISVAIYGMTPDRQLPLESYIGYTLFKNGFPSAYGGTWVFGKAAFFGINIFESFRGGESGFVMCQLLRVYRQAFNVNYIEVEPYQYGLNNPEGIQSGAFWFYYRYGFRPIDKTLADIAKKEQLKIAKGNNYRTSEKTLIRFTESNIALNLQNNTPLKVQDIALKISQHINKKYKGNRIIATSSSVENFKKLSGLKIELSKDQQKVLQEVALWAEAYDIKKSSQLKLMVGMIFAKPVDIFEYQQLLLNFFNAS